MDRSFISEPVRVGRHGRVTPEVRGIVRQSESGSGPVCASHRGVAWSSVRAHLAGRDDSMVSVRPVLDRWPTFRDLLLEDYEEKFELIERGGGHRAPAGHGGVRNRTRTSSEFCCQEFCCQRNFVVKGILLSKEFCCQTGLELWLAAWSDGAELSKYCFLKVPVRLTTKSDNNLDATNTVVLEYSRLGTRRGILCQSTMR
jgi:hypothetical protein